MEEALRISVRPARKKAADQKERSVLAEGLAQTRRQINQAYAGFDNADDPDLIDSFVFEINSLQARYNYLLRRLKELEGSL